jgi:hypothetical protein
MPQIAGLRHAPRITLSGAATISHLAIGISGYWSFLVMREVY